MDLGVAALTADNRIGGRCQLEITQDCINVLFPAGYPNRRALDDVWHAIWALQWPLFAAPNDGTWDPGCIDPSQLKSDDRGPASETAGPVASRGLFAKPFLRLQLP